MALEHAFRDLDAAIDRLIKCLGAFADSMRETGAPSRSDPPRRPGDTPKRLLCDTADLADEIRQSLCEAQAAARRGANAVRRPSDRDEAHAALAACGECVAQQLRRIFAEQTNFPAGPLLSHERVYRLARFGRNWGARFRDWRGLVHKDAQECASAAHDVWHGVVLSFLELSEQSGAGNINVRATSIGQKYVRQEQT